MADKKLSKDELIKAVEKMSVLELSDFVKALEEKFGVSAQAMVAQAPTNGAQAASAESSGEPKEETPKTEEAVEGQVVEDPSANSGQSGKKEE